MATNNSKRLVFLCSGGGGNLAFIHQVISRGWLPGVNIVAILTDRLCQANDFSDHVDLPNRIIDFNDDGQHNLLAELDYLKPDLVITTVHKIIGRCIVERYQQRLINLHYSLLPAFSGLIGSRSVHAALDHRVLFSGVTVHLVNENTDAGQPLVQGVIALQQDEELNSLMPVVFRSGCIALLSALISLLYQPVPSYSPVRLNILGRSCLFNGSSAIQEGLAEDEKFWYQLKQALNTAGLKNRSHSVAERVKNTESKNMLQAEAR